MPNWVEYKEFERKNVKNKLTIVYLVLLVIPGCARKNVRVAPMAGTVMPTAPIQPTATLPADEELKAFELEQNENPFNSAAPLETPEEAAMPTQEMAEQERFANSSQLGLKKIYYQFNDPKIREDQFETVKNNLKKAKELVNKGYEIVVEGHACDSAGSRDYNMHLSEVRAEGVADYFVHNGLDAQSISTVGRGCEMLIVPEGTKEQQAPNRRVEVYAYPKRAGTHSAYKVKS